MSYELNALDFHTAHPEVWEHFVKFTQDRIAHGFKHYSADAIMHRVRWETDDGAEVGFKINNNHVAFYARWYMKAFPNHDGFFRTRVQKSLLVEV